MQSMWEGYPKRIGNISISVNDMGQTIECDAAIEDRSLGCPIAWKFSIWKEQEKRVLFYANIIKMCCLKKENY